jgi:FAD dependent oxidoreductase
MHGACGPNIGCAPRPASADGGSERAALRPTLGFDAAAAIRTRGNAQVDPYVRWTPDHRRLLGGGDRPLRPERDRTRALQEGTRAVQDHFRALYPALDDVPFEYAWEGLFATTPDGLPYIGPHRRYARHLFALGYGGSGMTMGVPRRAAVSGLVPRRSDS